jgi:hypothetical protein
MGAQQPRHPLAADLDAVAAQLSVHPGRPVGLPGAVVDAADAVGQRLVVAPALARMAVLGDPAGEGRDGDVEDPEDGLDPEAVTMLGDEAHDRRRVGSSS